MAEDIRIDSVMRELGRDYETVKAEKDQDVQAMRKKCLWFGCNDDRTRFSSSFCFSHWSALARLGAHNRREHEREEVMGCDYNHGEKERAERLKEIMDRAQEQLKDPLIRHAHPVKEDQHTAGVKLDDGKESVDQGLFDYFPRALLAVAGISDFGASKYSWGGWRTVPNGYWRYTNAMGRHILKERIEGHFDKESNLLHAAHTAWNALARLELMMVECEEKGVIVP